MKKVLSSALALGMLVGVASTASAFDFSMKGYYLVEGDYATNMDRTSGVNLSASDDSSSAWYYHKLRAYPVLKVNDQTTLKAEIRLLHDDWGGGSGSDAAGADMVDWDKLWLEYNSPIGMMHIGTTPWGSWGTAFGDSGVRQNAVKWFPKLPKPFTSVVFFGKISENDSQVQTTITTPGGIAAGGADLVNNVTGALGADGLADVVADVTTSNVATDQDADYYEARFGYSADGMTAQLGLGLTDDQRTPDTNIEKWRLRGYARTSVAGLNVEGEFDHTFGDRTTGATTMDYDAWAAYAQVSGQADKLGWGVLAWYVSGDVTADNDLEAYGNGGTDFEPLLIATGDDFGLLQNDTTSVYTSSVMAFGQLAVGAWASMPVSDKMTLTTVIGSAWADDTTANIDDHYGYEIDIKADYKLLDNLTYSMNFGYFAAGDLFEDAHVAMGGVRGQDSDNVILLNHTLNMTF